jgi:2,3-dihydro-2,3-dihydroxybenzoate dehydrogenase
MEETSAVVIGGGQGIGAAIAQRLGRAEWCSDVVVADLHGELAEEVASGIPGATGRRVDVTDSDSLDALVAATAGAGHVAIAAGIFSASPALQTPRGDFERVLGVNLIGVFAAAQAYARTMADRGGGSIVAVASIAATMPRMRQAAYCASKAGMRQALRVLGMEAIAHGVRINTVSPGPTDTPMMRQLAADHASVDDLAAGDPGALRPRIPAGRVARPDDVAEVTAFLLSPESEHVVLRDFVVDGGETLGL